MELLGVMLDCKYVGHLFPAGADGITRIVVDIPEEELFLLKLKYSFECEKCDG